MKNNGKTIHIICEGVEYNFFDVPGDGIFFYNSLLKNPNLEQKFNNQENLGKD